MARMKYRLNHPGMAELLKDAGVRADLTKRAERVLSAAKAGAPVKSGAYRDGLHLGQDTTDRAVVRVASDVDYATEVEAATGNLAGSLDAAGGS